MGNVTLSFPTFGFVVGTRAALGAGVGLLVARRLSRRTRRRAGLALVLIGARHDRSRRDGCLQESDDADDLMRWCAQVWKRFSSDERPY